MLNWKLRPIWNLPVLTAVWYPMRPDYLRSSFFYRFLCRLRDATGLETKRLCCNTIQSAIMRRQVAMLFHLVTIWLLRYPYSSLSSSDCSLHSACPQCGKRLMRKNMPGCFLALALVSQVLTVAHYRDGGHERTPLKSFEKKQSAQPQILTAHSHVIA